MEKVVVTGMGVVSNVGIGVDAFWEGLMAGRSGIGPITSFDASSFKTRIAGQVNNYVADERWFKRVERFAQFAVSATFEALQQAGLVAPQGTLAEGPAAGRVDPWRVGVVVGTGIGGFPMIEQEHERFLKTGRFNPLTVPIIIPNMASANVAIAFGLHGPNSTVSTACSTGNQSLATAMDQLRLGRADVMVAGGTEAVISPFSLSGYIMLRALSTRNDTPQTASRPFSAQRDGFVLGEGCGVLVLETLSHAKKRGAPILAELAAVGMSCDAFHLTAPEESGKGAASAIRTALAEAGVAPGQVDYINAHGTSTPLNDRVETQAIKQVFGQQAYKIPVSSIKSMVGHSLGGSSALEAVACVKALETGWLPPTINLEEPDPELDLDYVPLQARQTNPRLAISNAFAFGGHNAVAVFRKP